MRHTVIDNEFVKLEFEMYQGEWIVHCNVYEWSPSLYKEYLSVWLEVMEEVHNSGIAILYAIFKADTNTDRFASMFGFVPMDMAEDKRTGEKHWIYKLDIGEVLQ